jgi:hypothetical protein
VEGDSKFSVPGHDGELGQETNFWRKGMVYTTRSPDSSGVCDGYRVSAGIKCSLGSWPSEVGFSRLYNRVKRVAADAIAKRTCAETGETPVGAISGYAWGTLGDGNGIGFALVMMGARCSPQTTSAERNHADPTDEMLLSSGGASHEELRLLSPQRADEVYNEFDFAGPTDEGPITLSYGEPVWGPAFDFEPVVQRAERLAADYRCFLSSIGEVRSTSLRILRREWFFASKDFATVHICFDR